MKAIMTDKSKHTLQRAKQTLTNQSSIAAIKVTCSLEAVKKTVTFSEPQSVFYSDYC